MALGSCIRPYAAKHRHSTPPLKAKTRSTLIWSQWELTHASEMRAECKSSQPCFYQPLTVLPDIALHINPVSIERSREPLWIGMSVAQH